MKKNFGKKDIIYLAVIALLTAAAVVFSILYFVKVNEEKEAESYYGMKCESFAVQNANLAKGQIVFIGDSITDLYALDSHYSTLPLAVYNRGIGGDTTEGVLKRLDVSLFDIMPSKIVLMIGTNDVNSRRENSKILDTYRDILEEIHRELPDAELFCMSIIPQNEDILKHSTIDPEESNKRIMELNPEIEKLAEEFGAVYVDLFSALVDPSNQLIKEYSDDGLHLNEKGFEVWRELIKLKLA